MSSIALSPSTLEQPRVSSWGKVALVSLATVVAAIFANVLVYFIGDLFVAYDAEFKILATVEPTISVTLMAGAIAVAVYAALLRFSRTPVRTYTIVSAVVLVLSIVPDFTLIPSEPGVSNAQIAILVLQHIVAAIVIVGMLTTLARPMNRESDARQEWTSLQQAAN
jgi:hypothetical protein